MMNLNETIEAAVATNLISRITYTPEGRDVYVRNDLKIQDLQWFAGFVADGSVEKFIRLDSDMYAEMGKVLMGFVDRLGDPCPEDPAEKICSELYTAIYEVTKKYWK